MRVARSWLLVPVLMLAGCSQSASPPTEQPAASKDRATAPLQAVDKAGLEQAIRARRGQVVLVDFWATWCVECVKLLPHTAGLPQRFGSQGLAVITLSMDDVDRRGAAQGQLGRAGATGTENLVTQYSEADSFTRFEIPGGALPHLRLYDRQGKLRETFGVASGKQATEQAIDAAVEKLLRYKTTAFGRVTQ